LFIMNFLFRTPESDGNRVSHPPPDVVPSRGVSVRVHRKSFLFGWTSVQAHSPTKKVLRRILSAAALVNITCLFGGYLASMSADAGQYSEVRC
jgi:hypothetical protein